MKHITLTLCALLLYTAASAQVRRIGSTPQQPDTTAAPQLSIMFNYQQPPSVLLEQSASYRRMALNTALIGGTAGGVIWYLGYKQQAGGGNSPLPVLGGGIMAASGIVAIILEYVSISKECKAGEELRKITISANGVTYHF